MIVLLRLVEEWTFACGISVFLSTPVAEFILASARHMVASMGFLNPGSALGAHFTVHLVDLVFGELIGFLKAVEDMKYVTSGSLESWYSLHV